MKALPYLLFLFVLFGCKQKENHPKIEIYLLKHPVASTEGIPILDVKELRDQHDLIKMDHLDSIRYDTVNKQMIFAGKFIAKESDLEDYPFIKDDEIYAFNPKKNTLVLDSVVTKRINYLFPGKRNVQFAITVDKKPVLNGYFWSVFSSRFANTYNIFSYQDKIPGEDPNALRRSHIIEFGPPEFYKGYKLKRPPYDKRMLDAFRKTGRLKE